MRAAAIGHIRVRCETGGEGFALVPGSELGAGGQATVYPVPGRPDRVAKIYHHPAPEHELKLRRMIARPLAGGAGSGVLAWPQQLLRDEEGRFTGLLLPRVEGKLRLFELYNPATRRDRAPLFHHGLLHRAAGNLSAAFHVIHEAGYVVGDVNESNILVGEDGRVVLIDTDSFQVRDPASGAVFRCPVGRPEFTPPELRECSFADVDRTPEHDRFGLGVLVFQMLMEGTHPFAGRFRGAGEPPSIQERIAAGHFPHSGRADVPLDPPRTAPPLATLDPGVRALLRRCFEDGHHDLAARPAAAEWRDVLEAAEAALVACGRNEQHRYAAHLGDCPWCERARRLDGRDPFPSTAAVRRGEHRPRPVPVRAARHSASGRAPGGQRPPVTLRPRFRAIAKAGAWPLPAHLRNGWFLAALLVALVGTATAAMPPLSLALVAGGLALLAKRMAPSRHSTQWGIAFTMVFLGLGLALGGGAGGERVEIGPPSSALELRPVRSFDPPPVEFAYAPEALDRLPVLQDTAALLAAVAPLYYESVPDGKDAEFQLRFVLDSSGLVDLETVQFSPKPTFYAMDVFGTRLAPVRFRPGELNGRPVRTEMRVPLRDAGDTMSILLDQGSWNPGTDGAARPSDPDLDWLVPDVADAEVKPQLLNADEVQALLAETYPPLLRDAGITGQTVMSFVVDEEGTVDRRSIVVVSATHEGFAQASASVVWRMQFRPAWVVNRISAVRMQIPISWTLQPG